MNDCYRFATVPSFYKQKIEPAGDRDRPGSRAGCSGNLHEAHSYHKTLLADLRREEVILIDPMLATGGSAVAALDLLTERRARHVRLVNLVAAPEGIRRVRSRYADVPIFTAAIDRKLNFRGYILPGLGDAGDRLFGV